VQGRSLELDKFKHPTQLWKEGVDELAEWNVTGHREKRVSLNPNNPSFFHY
jgi:hypothetical protein